MNHLVLLVMHHHQKPSFLPSTIKIREDHRKRPSTSMKGGDKVGRLHSCSLTVPRQTEDKH
ncbi:unnamed protein product [Musa textilis]